MLPEILIACTVLGGLAAIWYFKDKISDFWNRKRKKTYSEKSIYVYKNDPIVRNTIEELKKQGYLYSWSNEDRVIERLEAGKEYALYKQKDGTSIILKVKDRPYDQILLKKKIHINIRYHYGITSYPEASHDFLIHNLENKNVQLLAINLEYWHKDHKEKKFSDVISKGIYIAPSNEAVINFKIRFSKLEKEYPKINNLKYFRMRPTFKFEIQGNDFEISYKEMPAN